KVRPSRDGTAGSASRAAAIAAPSAAKKSVPLAASSLAAASADGDLVIALSSGSDFAGAARLQLVHHVELVRIATGQGAIVGGVVDPGAQHRGRLLHVDRRLAFDLPRLVHGEGQPDRQ